MKIKPIEFVQVESHSEDGIGLLAEDDQIAVLLTVTPDHSVRGWRWSVESVVPYRCTWLDGVRATKEEAIAWGKKNAADIVVDLTKELARKSPQTSEKKVRVRIRKKVAE